MHSRPAPSARPGSILALAATFVLAAALAACGGAAQSPTAPSPAGPTPAAPTTVPGGERSAAPPPGVVTTDWGRAWDALPAGFPLPPGAETASPGDPTDGPVSGAFVTHRPAAATARAMADGLAAAAFHVEPVGDPLEDGSRVIDAAGVDPACRVQVRVRPLGGLTMITVLYGAACPWK